MRISAVLAAGAALMFATAAGATPREEADDRLTEALLGVQFSGTSENVVTEDASGQPFMVTNPGNAGAVVVGCERRCQGIAITLRAAGLPDVRARTNTQRLVLEIPATHVRSLSNYELDIDVECGGADCVRHWVMTLRGVPASAQSRGLPRPITEAEWNGAGETLPLSQITWQSTPTADDLRFFYPVREWRAGQAGEARLQCLIGDGGALRCRAVGQSAFNDAALKLATRLRAPTADASGQSLANRRIVVPIRFEPQS